MKLSVEFADQRCGNASKLSSHFPFPSNSLTAFCLIKATGIGDIYRD